MRTPRSILTMRRDCCNTTSTWRGSFSHCRAKLSASGEGVTSLRWIRWPSALDTTFWVTTTISPACSGNGAAADACWIRAATSMPGVTMGIPGRPMTRSSGRLMKHAHTSEGEKPAQGAPEDRASPALRNSGTAPVGPQTGPDHLVRRCPGQHVGDGGFRPPGDAQPPGADDAESCRGQRPGRDNLEVTTPSRSFPGRPGWALTRPAPVAPEG